MSISHLLMVDQYIHKSTVVLCLGLFSTHSYSISRLTIVDQSTTQVDNTSRQLCKFLGDFFKLHFHCKVCRLVDVNQSTSKCRLVDPLVDQYSPVHLNICLSIFFLSLTYTYNSSNRLLEFITSNFFIDRFPNITLVKFFKNLGYYCLIHSESFDCNFTNFHQVVQQIFYSRFLGFQRGDNYVLGPYFLVNLRLCLVCVLCDLKIKSVKVFV